MLKLGRSGRLAAPLRAPVIGRITTASVQAAVRPDHVLMTSDVSSEADLAGYAAVLCSTQPPAQADSPVVHDVTFEDLAPGDVVSISPSGYVRTLYRRSSRHNALFTTDRCNSYCLMCSQPPKNVDDSGRVREILRLIELISPDTPELGITGGEPTLLGDGLLTIVRRCKELLPRTALHLLSNGRLFYYGSLARALAAIEHPDLMVGVPIYSDIDADHDWIVQSRGAFDDTMVGLQNLGRFGVPVEIRVVVHALTYERLPELAEFIYRNLTFAAHVAFMGLEATGFAVPNLDALWIDPSAYQQQVSDAIWFLDSRAIRVSIYNHQLCTTPERLWPFCKQSISDWKSEYLPECAECAVRASCAGVFATARGRMSTVLHPITFAAGLHTPEGPGPRASITAGVST